MRNQTLNQSSTKMTFTFIETPGHGYLKVSKSQFLKSGADKHKISKYSGIGKSHLYLEEDCDATYFIWHLNQMGIKHNINSVYKKRVNTTHNYNPYNF